MFRSKSIKIFLLHSAFENDWSPVHCAVNMNILIYLLLNMRPIAYNHLNILSNAYTLIIEPRILPKLSTGVSLSGAI